MRTVLHIDGLHKHFQDGDVTRAVLNDVSLDIGAGEVVSVSGPSGSGKSTLLNLVAGILVPDAGEMRLDTPQGSFDLASPDEEQRTRQRRRHLGYVFQFYNLIPTLTVRENVLLPLELNGLDTLDSLVDASLDRLAALGLDDRLDDFPEQLSGGERQRTAIARALAHEPMLVLADEPTGNLDRDNADQVAEVLWQQVRGSGAAMLIATHDALIAERADRQLTLSA